MKKRFFAGEAGSYGRLGNNATTDKDHPVSVKSVDGASELDGIVEVAAWWLLIIARLNLVVKSFAGEEEANGQLGNDKSDDTNKLPTYVVDGDGSSTHLDGYCPNRYR